MRWEDDCEWCIGKNLESGGLANLKTLSWHLLGQTEEHNEKCVRMTGCPYQYLQKYRLCVLTADIRSIHLKQNCTACTIARQ
jgi:hypothetical protein